MKTTFLLSLAIGMSLQASSSRELHSLVEGNTNSYESIVSAKQNLGACWCSPVPCWGESCQTSYPENCLTKYNRAQEKGFRELFPQSGPWDAPGNPIKKCLVQYMRKTTPYNCTTATAASATALAATLCGAGIGSVAICVGKCCGEVCCGCETTEHNICSQFIIEMCCPFTCYLHQPLCCPPNVYNVLTMLAEVGCLALPFACYGAECCCVNCLADPKRWTGSDNPQTQPVLSLDEESN